MNQSLNQAGRTDDQGRSIAGRERLQELWSLTLCSDDALEWAGVARFSVAETYLLSWVAAFQLLAEVLNMSNEVMSTYDS